MLLLFVFVLVVPSAGLDTWKEDEEDDVDDDDAMVWFHVVCLQQQQLMTVSPRSVWLASCVKDEKGDDCSSSCKRGLLIITRHAVFSAIKGNRTNKS
jgi:hypothetical protein